LRAFMLACRRACVRAYMRAGVLSVLACNRSCVKACLCAGVRA
jgi:hypothetical protein